MAKKQTEEMEFSFQNFLNLLSVDDLIENVKIESTSKGKLFSQVVDPDQTMMGEILFTENVLSKMIGEPITIFNLQKLISMISYVDDAGAGDSQLKIKEDVLAYSNGPKSVVYRLGDSSVMKSLDIEKNISDFIEAEEIKFTLSNHEIRELLKALNIAERDGQLEIVIKEGKVVLVIGKIDKVFLKPAGEISAIDEADIKDTKITLQTKIMIRVLRTMLQVPGSESIVFCRPGYPAVMQLNSPMNKNLSAAFLIAPLVDNELE